MFNQTPIKRTWQGQTSINDEILRAVYSHSVRITSGLNVKGNIAYKLQLIIYFKASKSISIESLLRCSQMRNGCLNLSLTRLGEARRIAEIIKTNIGKEARDNIQFAENAHQEAQKSSEMLKLCKGWFRRLQLSKVWPPC